MPICDDQVPSGRFTNNYGASGTYAARAIKAYDYALNPIEFLA